MSKIYKLTDIEIYQEALKLTKEVYDLVKHQRLRKDFSLVDQLKRASLSVAINISEGYGRKTNKDFAQFLSISLGSANEVNTLLEFTQIEYHIETKTIQNKYDLLAKRIFSFRSYLSRNPQPITHNSQP